MILIGKNMVMLKYSEDSFISSESSDKLFTNPLVISKMCVKKSCVKAFKEFYSLTDHLILDRYQLSLIQRLKCLVGKKLSTTDHTLSINESACSYDISESFIKSPEIDRNSDYLALQQYQDLLDKILGEVFHVMKHEASAESGTKVLSTLLDISNNVKALIMQIKSIVQKFSECSCEALEETREMYIQSYDTLSKKYDHRKSMFIILKQLYILKKSMTKDIWNRQKKYILCDTSD